MNLKEELQKMNIRDLKSICKELGVSCPTDKKNIIKKLLEPLKKRYNMEIELTSTSYREKIKKKISILQQYISKLQTHIKQNKINIDFQIKFLNKELQKLKNNKDKSDWKRKKINGNIYDAKYSIKFWKNQLKIFVKLKKNIEKKIEKLQKILNEIKFKKQDKILSRYRMNTDKEDWELVLDRMEEEEKKEEKERKLYEILRKPVRKYITKKRRTKKRAIKTIQRVYKRFKKYKELERKKSKKRMLTPKEKKSSARCILWFINYKFGKKEQVHRYIKDLKVKLYNTIQKLKQLDKKGELNDNQKKLRFLWSNSKRNLNALNTNILLTQTQRHAIKDFVKTYKNIKQINAEKAERNRKLKERRKKNKLQSEKDKRKARENNLKRGDAMIIIKDKKRIDKHLAKTQMCKHGSKCKRKKTCKFAHSKDELVRAICRFGRLCKRRDCYYAHPDGRKIDEKPEANNNLQLKEFFSKK